MNNDEIRALLRELKERSDASDEVKSKPIKISFGEEEPPAREKSRGKSPFGKRKTEKPRKEEPVKEAAAEKQKEERPVEAETAEETLEPENAQEMSIQPEQKTERTEKVLTKEKEPEKLTDLGKNQRKITPLRKSKKKPVEGDYDFLDGDEADFRDSDELLLEARRNGAIGRSPWKNLKLAVQSYLDDLKEKGIGEKELIMIGSGAVLVVFLAFVVYSASFSKDKSINVTADEGLYVTVEKEPENWCSNGSVELGIRASATIQSVTVNGKSMEVENGRRVTVNLETDTEILELMVVTEENVLNAQVEIPMIDSEAPGISVSQENGQVTISALDERSGLEGVYYGTVSGFSDVPRYQKYTGPFLYEEGKTYYYYAQDFAGNKTVPVATNMEPAQQLVLNETEMTLFPGDSFSLSVSTSPSESYCNHLQITNQNTDIVRLDSNGTVTALKEGDAQIQVSADGLPSVSCVVHVSNEAEITITTIGDCTLGDDIYFSASNSFSTVYAMYGYDYFFQNVKSVLEADDITFANFEGVLTTLDTREVKEYAFKGAPEYTSILKDASIEAVTLANNHSSDYGAQSLIDTKQYLTEAGIDYCTGEEIIYKEVQGAKVALIGIYVLDTGIEKASQVEQTIATAKQNGADLIIVGFHWGSEKSNYPDEVQQSLAHTAVDCGADLVVGHHPHVLQGIEQYQGKYIVYSLGNFCFGGNSNPSDTDTMIFQQTFSVNKSGEVVDSSINIIPCSITSQYGWNSYQPTIQEGTEAERIMGRINEYSAQFGLIFE